VPDQQKIKYAPADPVSVQVFQLSPHVLVYAVWTKEPNQPWQMRTNGSMMGQSFSTTPFSLGVVKQETQLYISLGFGGKQTHYEGRVELSQPNHTTDSSGVFKASNNKKTEDAFVVFQGVFAP